MNEQTQKILEKINANTTQTNMLCDLVIQSALDMASKAKLDRVVGH